MKKSIIVVVAVLVVLAVAAVVVMRQSGNDSTSMQGMNMEGTKKSKMSAKDTPQLDLTDQKEVAMDIKDFAYSKPNIKVKVGTTVTWTNQDTVKHNVILEGTAKGAPSKDEVRADVFAGQLLAKGESYSFTFKEVTSNGYICSPHPYMKGIVNVVE